MPRVDIGEQILEVMGWVPQFLESLTALSRREPTGTASTRSTCFSPGAANLPEVLVADRIFSDLIFGIASLLGVDYRPALADLPDQKE